MTPPKKKPVYNEEARKLLIDQTRKAAKFYRQHLEDRETTVLAVDSDEVLFVVAVGPSRQRLLGLIAGAELAAVETDPGA